MAESLCDLLREETCKSLGFTPSLVCSSCDELDTFGLNAIIEDCQMCCKEDGNPDGSKVICDSESQDFLKHEILMQRFPLTCLCLTELYMKLSFQMYPFAELVVCS